MLENLRVLVVDDMGAARQMLARMLLRLGVHRVEAVGCGAEALDYLGVCDTDLVISDLHMPDLDGLDLLRKIRTNPRLRHTQFTLATGQDGGAHLNDCPALDVAMVLTKPFRMDLLMECVSDAAKRLRHLDMSAKPSCDQRPELRA